MADKPEEKRMDTLVDALFQSLPASSYDEIRRGMSKELGERIALGMVGATLAHLRKNTAKYEWTVPHVKRGPGTEDDQGRFFAMLLEKDESFTFDPEHRQHLDGGRYSTIATVETQTRNLATALQVATQYESIKARREEFEDACENLNFVARRLERMRKKIA